jgi:MFS transporter, DHA2 family, multidrug resistance protein
VPLGILLIMAAMWMLSGSTSESGARDMMGAILLRGLGLGFLFLSITLIAFTNLNNRNRASGIGLFNAGRQLGGLIGVGLLQRLIDHNVAGNLTVLGASVTSGVSAVSDRLTATTAMLAGKGMDAMAASRAATSLLGRAVTGQSTVIAFDTAFNAVALLFVFAAPVLVTIKIGFHRYAQMHVLRGHPEPSSDRMDHPALAPALPDNDESTPDARADVVLAISEALAYRRGAHADLDSILNGCGYSKDDILSAFENIDDAFVAVAERKASLISEPLTVRPGTVADVRDTLIAFGRIAWNEYSTTLVGLLRMTMTEGTRNAPLKKRVYEAGAATVTLKLREFLSEANEKGLLSISNAQLAAEQLIGRLREPLYQALMLNPAASREEATTDSVKVAIDTFIHGCASPSSAAP